MPTDRPSAADRTLATILAEHGVERAPRTIIGWRRLGVLMPAGTPDDDDVVRFSDAAITQALTWARLREHYSEPEAVLALWGGGADLDAPVVISAWRRWAEDRAKRYSDLSVRLSQATTSERTERALHETMGKAFPALAQAFTEQATTPGESGDDEPARVGEIRAEATSEVAEYLATGGGDDLTDVVAERLGLTDTLGPMLDTMTTVGLGVPSMPEILATVDELATDQAAWGQLCSLRTVLGTGVLGWGAEVASPPTPLLGPLLALLGGIDPDATALLVAISTLVWVTSLRRVMPGIIGIPKAPLGDTALADAEDAPPSLTA